MGHLLIGKLLDIESEPETVEPFRIAYRPGDTLVLQNDVKLSEAAFNRIATYIASVIPGANVVILDGGTKVHGVITPDSE